MSINTGAADFDSSEELPGSSLGVGTSSSTRFSQKSSSHSGISCDRHLRAPGVSSSIFLFLVFLNCDRSPCAPPLALSLRVVGGRIVDSSRLWSSGSRTNRAHQGTTTFPPMCALLALAARLSCAPPASHKHQISAHDHWRIRSNWATPRVSPGPYVGLTVH